MFHSVERVMSHLQWFSHEKVECIYTSFALTSQVVVVCASRAMRTWHSYVAHMIESCRTLHWHMSIFYILKSVKYEKHKSSAKYTPEWILCFPLAAISSHGAKINKSSASNPVLSLTHSYMCDMPKWFLCMPCCYPNSWSLQVFQVMVACTGVINMKRSCFVHEMVVIYIWKSHGIHMQTSCFINERVVFCIWKSHVLQRKESCVVSKTVVNYICMIKFLHIYASCCTSNDVSWNNHRRKG